MSSRWREGTHQAALDGLGEDDQAIAFNQTLCYAGCVAVLSTKCLPRMADYIDGFVLPVPRNRLNEYRRVAEVVAGIWKEHGAIDYLEYVGDDLNREGTRSFTDLVAATENDIIVFGWVVFDSREARDLANERVAADPRMADLIAPLIDPSNPVFDAERMAYGGFRSLI